jgi:hypothetical protein
MQTVDFLLLPFPRDLTEGGIAYATRSLSHSTNRTDATVYDRLRHNVASVAVELAFRHYLTENKIPFKIKGAAAFTNPDRYDVSLGGHRCDVRSFLISHRNQIQQIHQDPGILLDAPALVPLDQDAGDGHNDDDIYLFAFLTGLIAASQTDLQKALASGQPIHLLHALPRSWANPQTWTPLGQLVLKSESDSPVTVELGGQTEDREFVSERLLLPPHTRVEAQTMYYSVCSLHVESPPDGRVAIHTPTRDETHIIQPYEWNNIWVYGMDIFLVGWISRAEFRQRANLILPGTRVFQFNRTRVKNLAMAVRELHPLVALLEKVKAWKSKK